MTHDEMIAVIQAHKDGEDIQYNDHGWHDCIGVCKVIWNFGDHDYRVKPKKPEVIGIGSAHNNGTNPIDRIIGTAYELHDHKLFVELTPEVSALLGDMVDE